MPRIMGGRMVPRIMGGRIRRRQGGLWGALATAGLPILYDTIHSTMSRSRRNGSGIGSWLWKSLKTVGKKAVGFVGDWVRDNAVQKTADYAVSKLEKHPLARDTVRALQPLAQRGMNVAVNRGTDYLQRKIGDGKRRKLFSKKTFLRRRQAGSAQPRANYLQY